MACGKKSDIEEKNIENENIVVEDEKDIEEIKENNEDVEDEILKDDKISEEEEVSVNKKLDNPVSNKPISKDNTNTVEQKKKNNTNIGEKSSSSNTGKIKESSVSIIIIGPEDVGTILETTEVELEDGDTAFDILKQVAKDNNIQMEYKGKKSSVYIEGIDNIYEFDKGPESGWIFRVNGEVSQVSSGAYKLSDGDKIEWLYTSDLGREFESKGGGK